MEIKVNKEKNNTYKVEVKVESSKVNEALDKALEHEAHEVEVKGFRKGKAPLNIVKDKIDTSKLKSHALRHFLADIYTQVIKEHKLQPIIQPRFTVKTLEEGQDADIEIAIIEKPDIKLGDYKAELA